MADDMPINDEEAVIEDLLQYLQGSNLNQFVDLLREAYENGYCVVKIVVVDHRIDSFRIERMIK